LKKEDLVEMDDKEENRGRPMNTDQFTQDEQSLITTLLDAGQEHLFAEWDNYDDLAAKQRFLSELAVVEASYPGGIAAYVTNARALLADARIGANPYDGFVPEQPDVVDLSSLNATYCDYEQIGLDNVERLGVVLVAGGLGERLGYGGIKLDIPVEAITSRSYLAHYASVLLAMQQRSDSNTPVPLIIMTSRDTHERTIVSLKQNNYFGLQPQQVTIVKQELVPAIADNDGRLATKGPFELVLKPHGHGDIHMLLYTSGMAQKLKELGKTHLLFIQDTNGQVFNAALAALGTSVKHDFDFNSVAVNRIPGEAVGALAKLVRGPEQMTINVEYNQLDPLLRATVSPEGDVPNAAGHSLFPGNINVLVVALDSYCRVLDESRGIIAEFVNPKYADDTKTTFKKPTRLETMMQDLPKLFDSGQKVGVTVFDRQWCFSADKNNIVDAKAKHEAGGPPESAATAESDFYRAGRMRCACAGADISAADEQLIRGIPMTPGPRIIISPACALTLSEAQEKIQNCSFSDESTLILDGADITLERVMLRGHSALVISAVPGASVTVKDYAPQNDGYGLVPLTDEEMTSDNTPEYLKIRGYRFEDRGAARYVFDQPGDYTIGPDGVVG
jgi:UDP-sugar pyrophosphorylase